MERRLRVRLAVVLARAAAALVAGRDDRVVILNTQRWRTRGGIREWGRRHAFVTDEPKSALAFPPGEAPEGIGVPVPVCVAKLAGYEIRDPFVDR